MLETQRGASNSSVPRSISFAGKNSSSATCILSWPHALVGFALLDFSNAQGFVPLKEPNATFTLLFLKHFYFVFEAQRIP